MESKKGEQKAWEHGSETRADKHVLEAVCAALLLPSIYGQVPGAHDYTLGPAGWLELFCPRVCLLFSELLFC